MPTKANTPPLCTFGYRLFIRTPQSGHSSLFGYFVLALNPSITSRFSGLLRAFAWFSFLNVYLKVRLKIILIDPTVSVSKTNSFEFLGQNALPQVHVSTHSVGSIPPRICEI